MKKFFAICLSVFMCLGVCVFKDKVFTKASDNSILVSSEIIIANDTTYTENLLISNNGDMSTCFTVKSGATLTISNCTIDGTKDISPYYTFIDNIFVIESGGKLILDNVILQNLKYDGAIANSGKIEINNVSFIDGLSSIINTSSENNSILLRSGCLEKVTLSSGYITVDKDSDVTGITTIILDNATIGRLIVKGEGENVFASKYINNFVYPNASETIFLDYIGDHDSSVLITDVVTGKTLQSGDIILSQLDASIKTSYLDSEYIQTMNYPVTYCTANHLQEIKNYFFRNAKLGLKLDNYSALIDSEVSYTRVTNANDKVVTARVNVMKEGSDSVVSYTDATFNAGNFHAVFVDIPEGYEYKNAKYFVNGTENSNIINVSEEKYSNGVYMRPILKYIPTTYNNYNVEINLIFAKVEKEASISVTAKDNITVNYDQKMIAGNSYTFTIPYTSSAIINEVYFNGSKVTLLEDTTGYYFTSIVNETNTLVINSLYNLVVTPKPTITTFVYGENIVLSEEYYVNQTDETIIINYTPDTNINVGTYYITKATCENNNYNIEVAEGKYSYTIKEKEILIEEVVETKDVELEYSDDINLSADMFITSLPQYLSAELILDNYDPSAVTQSLQIKFYILNKNYAIKDNKNTISVNLKFIPTEINTDACVFTDTSTPYTGEVIEIFVEDYDENIVTIEYTYSLILEDDSKQKVDFAKDCGVYEVVAKFYSKHSLYITSYEMTAKLEITKVNIDLSEYIDAVSICNIIYDGDTHTLETKEDLLPSEVKMGEVKNNTGYDSVGQYVVIINLVYDKKNYECVDSVECLLSINKKEVGISLEQNTFVYSGVAPVLKPVVTGLINEDICDVILGTNIQTDIGKYYVSVIGLSNENYTFEEGLELEYVIDRMVVDLNNISYENIVVDYDGQRHMPVFIGDIPEDIEYTIDYNVPCKNAGVYIVKCTFSSDNLNYALPEPIYATVTINKRPVYVEFEEPTDMMANGIAKRIIVTFTGVVDGDTIVYEENYSNEPILAGEYTLSVSIPKDGNYYLDNSSSYSFNIFTNYLTIRSNDVSVKMEGKFTASDTATVNKVNNKNVTDVLEGENIKGYTTLNFTYTNYSSDPIKVSVKADSVVSDTRYLKMYRVVGSSLEELEYTLDNDIITFNLSSNGEIVFVEGNTMVYTFRYPIGIICALALFSLLGYAIPVIIYKRKSNPYFSLIKKKK